MESSKQKMIDTVITHKNRIVKASNEIIKRLSEPQKSTSRRDTSLYVKKRVNQIISNLSIIGGFCGNREKELIILDNEFVRILLETEDVTLFAPIIEDWCVMVNGIIVDFTKTPFRFVSGEFKVNLRNLEAKMKAILERE